MKKFIGILLVAMLLCGFLGLGVAAKDQENPLTWPELALGQQVDLELYTDPDDGTQGYVGQYRFTPIESGWYVFRVIFPTSSWLLGTMYAFDFDSVAVQIMGNFGPLLLMNMADQVVNKSEFDMLFGGGTSIAYLEGGKEYYVVAAVASIGGGIGNPGPEPPVGIYQAVVKKANVTGYGKVQPSNLAIDIGEQIGVRALFSDLPPYHVLRVEVLGDAVDQNLRGVKVGTSTLVFRDIAGTEVGRSTITVGKWWQTLPSFLQLILRWFAFGWLWMG